ncbi:glycosyltransferase family 4 protein [Candidatus Electrothrix sp.]|uniref:glycosyltransferase family 4 protein n=1 Tax=Candidatus Electrothrix sp. TaxID=2170559 RepID=UPI004055F5F1
MKIALFLGSPAISGGTYVIYEHASRLQKKGHQVTLVTREQVQAEEYAWHSSAHGLEWLRLEQAKKKSFDMVLATWWQSPFLLHELQATHYAYFVQSIETRFIPPDPLGNTIKQDLCENTYSYALPIITEATWIQEYIYTKYNNYPQLVRNGIRKDIYTEQGKTVAPRKPGRLRVLVEGPVDVTYKNVPASIRLAKKARADEIWLLTSSNIDQYDHVDRIFSQIPIHQTPAIYRSCDLVLKLSYVEGMFGPPLEMFHCGGTALVYDVTGHDEYIIHNQNSYVVEQDNEEEVVRLLRHLKENPDELARLKQGAAQTASEWLGWEAAADFFEQALLKIAAKHPTSREYLKRYTEELFATKKSLQHAKAYTLFVDREKAVWKGKQADKNNFMEFYWDSQGNFTPENSQCQYYPSEKQTAVTFELEVKEVPLWLRIDPSVQIGILEIECITVHNRTQDIEVMTFQEPDDFQTLFLTGDAKWLFPDKKNIIFSYGDDPILLLPVITEDQMAPGETLALSVTIKETGIQQFLRTHQLSFPDTSLNNELAQSRWKRIAIAKATSLKNRFLHALQR